MKANVKCGCVSEPLQTAFIVLVHVFLVNVPRAGEEVEFNHQLSCFMSVSTADSRTYFTDSRPAGE